MENNFPTNDPLGTILIMQQVQKVLGGKILR